MEVLIKFPDYFPWWLLCYYYAYFLIRHHTLTQYFTFSEFSNRTHLIWRCSLYFKTHYESRSCNGTNSYKVVLYIPVCDCFPNAHL